MIKVPDIYEQRKLLAVNREINLTSQSWERSQTHRWKHIGVDTYKLYRHLISTSFVKTIRTLLKTNDLIADSHISPESGVILLEPSKYVIASGFNHRLCRWRKCSLLLNPKEAHGYLTNDLSLVKYHKDTLIIIHYYTNTRS